MNTIRMIGNSLQSLFLLLIRLYWGYQFAITGIGKFINLDSIVHYFQSLHIPFPFANAILAGSVETLGGVCLFLGLFSRIAAIPLFALLLTALFSADFDAVSALYTHFDADPFFKSTPALFIYAVLIIFIFGPGKYSLDYWLTRSYKKKEMP